jgi:hypothetical protein
MEERQQRQLRLLREYVERRRLDDRGATPPKPSPSSAVPPQKWPFVVRVLASRRQAREVGVGDTAKRLLHRMGADGLAWLYEKTTGRDCGCGDRQERLNHLYPY